MNVLFLSPHFPPNYYLFCERLRELGVNVLGIADQPFHELRPELREALTWYYHVSDLHNYDEVHAATAFLSHRFGRMDRIDSLNEHWIEMEARLRSDFNVEGFKLDDLPAIKRKSEMKHAFRQADIPVARGRVVNTVDEARVFVADVGYPVVAKPDVGVGASRTFAIGGPHDLEYFLSGPFQGYFLEEYVHGAIITFDGIADRDSNPAFFTSMEYHRGVMEVVNDDDDVHYWIVRNIAPDLEQAGRNILRAFNVRERFFHFEFFRTANGRLLALEVNMRPPGGLSVDMFNFAHEIDLYAEWAHMLVHGHMSRGYERPYTVCYAGRKNNKHYMVSFEEVFERFGERIIHHQPMPSAFRQAMGDYGFVIRTYGAEEAVGIAREIQAKY